MIEGKVLQISQPSSSPSTQSHGLSDIPSGEEHERTLATLTSSWNVLYKERLPTLARDKSPSQRVWPVHLDHCFARIILDAVVGNSAGEKKGVKPCPWTERLERPAVKHMSVEQLGECIGLGEAIAEGEVDLVELDRASLGVRGKSKGKVVKRKMDDTTVNASTGSKKQKTFKSTGQQADIRTAMGLPPTPPKSPSKSDLDQSSQPPAVSVDPSLTSKINLHPCLTPFRRRVLLALCQVPPGHFTTYLAISNFLHSSPRAVGNALRNNPFAPEVPCHRVVAANGGRGGFGGEWGVQGRFNMEKVRLLRGKGVSVVDGGGRVVGRAWNGFL